MQRMRALSLRTLSLLLLKLLMLRGGQILTRAGVPIIMRALFTSIYMPQFILLTNGIITPVRHIIRIKVVTLLLLLLLLLKLLLPMLRGGQISTRAFLLLL